MKTWFGIRPKKNTKENTMSLKMLQLKVALNVSKSLVTNQPQDLWLITTSFMAFVAPVATPIVGPRRVAGSVWIVAGEISKKGLGVVGVKKRIPIVLGKLRH